MLCSGAVFDDVYLGDFAGVSWKLTALSRSAQLFSRELATTNNLKLHVVGAVYSAKLGWSMAHDGRSRRPTW